VSEIADRYRRRADAFEHLVAAVPADAWGNPSPCAAWTARDVVGHVVDMHGVVLAPVGVDGAGPAVADDPLGAFRAVRAAVEAVLADPGLSATPSDTPAGPLSAADNIDQVVSDDMPLHGWDLARATGQDDTIDPADVERLWATTLAVPPELMARYRTPGAFGPGVEVYGPEVVVPEDAPLPHRLLGAIGRDPAWAPPGA
jgi:uncharacterized protein (TIGR03086 family)